MPGRQAASSDLPAPGGPIISMLWPPAAAISSARLAVSWPFTCARSGPPPGGSASPGAGGASTAVPRRWLSKAMRSGAAITSISPAQAASAPCAAGQIRPSPRAEAWMRGEQHAGRRRDPPVEAELADREIGGSVSAIDRAHRGEQAERDRQIVMRAFLGQIGGREVDRDPLRRQRQADRGERGMDPLAALRHRLVGQADDEEFRQARGDLHLHLDGARLQPEKSDRGDVRDHQAPSPEHSTRVRHPPSSAV